MVRQKFHEFVYKVENVLDEFLIVVLAFGAIIVTLKNLMTASGVSWSTWGKLVFEWVVMLALMIIGRELWLLNRKVQRYIEMEGE